MNRNDRKIAIASLVVAALALGGIWLAQPDDTQDNHQAYKTPQPHQSPQPHKPHQPYPTRKVEEFPFDPNTADSTQLLRLGLQPWQIRNIYKYRSRGGIYRTKEDFARLYGLTVKDYRRLEPYIRISSDYLPASTLVGEKKPYERDTVSYPIKIEEGETVVLNLADTTQLKKVPGIGSYYAHEIVRHGQRLGGYVSVDQLDEIDNFPPNAKKYLVIRHANPQKLNINKLSIAQLRRHPYVNYHQAKAIIDYRRLHGDIKSLQELRLSRDFPPEAIRRLEPYVEY